MICLLLLERNTLIMSRMSLDCPYEHLVSLCTGEQSYFLTEGLFLVNLVSLRTQRLQLVFPPQ